MVPSLIIKFGWGMLIFLLGLVRFIYFDYFDYLWIRKYGVLAKTIHVFFAVLKKREFWARGF